VPGCTSGAPPELSEDLRMCGVGRETGMVSRHYERVIELKRHHPSHEMLLGVVGKARHHR
jgi:hypothetical protein